MIPQYILYVLIGLFTGFCGGMLGIGGGSIRIPLLVLAGMPLVNAFGTNMFAIPFSASMGAYVQRAHFDWSIAKRFTSGAMMGILISTFFVGVISDKILAIVFFIAAILTIFGLYLDKINRSLHERIRRTPWNLFLGGFFSNLIIGLRGGAGGTLFAPSDRHLIVCCLLLFTDCAVSLFLSWAYPLSPCYGHRTFRDSGLLPWKHHVHAHKAPLAQGRSLGYGDHPREYCCVESDPQCVSAELTISHEVLCKGSDPFSIDDIFFEDIFKESLILCLL